MLNDNIVMLSDSEASRRSTIGILRFAQNDNKKKRLGMTGWTLGKTMRDSGTMLIRAEERETLTSAG
ncbi:MAG: hypothetical protein C4335_09910 [Armatimonadota bacterium]